jgi:hypothetical protein
VILGLEGNDPATVDVTAAYDKVEEIAVRRSIQVKGTRPIDFDPSTDVTLHRHTSLPQHPNGMTFGARDSAGATIQARTCFSVGGGFVVEEGDELDNPTDDADVPHPFSTAAELLAHCASTGLAISSVVMISNETSGGGSSKSPLVPNLSSHDNALAESFNGVYTTAHPRRPALTGAVAHSRVPAIRLRGAPSVPQATPPSGLSGGNVICVAQP